MHPIQQKLLTLIEKSPLSGLTLREIGAKVGEPESPQKVKHHLDQLAAKGFIVIDKNNNTIEKMSHQNSKGNVISLPIMGSANCGEATFFADGHVEGYLQVTKKILGDLATRVKDLFVLQAVGQSMNRADVEGDTIENGDYVIVDKKVAAPQDGQYVVSIINGVANIKKIYLDKKKSQIILLSESSQDIPPIYVHQDDVDGYLIAGKIVKVMKTPDELIEFQNASGRDILKDLGPISREEYDYYENICSKNQK
jgi:SOS-response transcriptional repressor LexA